MKSRSWVEPGIWGLIGGAAAAMIIGFSWGGWVTGGTAGQMEEASAKSAVIQALVPVCVSKAEGERSKLVALKEQSQWKRDDFVTEAGWVDNVSDDYRSDVARACASALVEGMKTD